MTGLRKGSFHLYVTTVVVAVVWIVLDQATKEWAVRLLEGQVPRDFGPVIFRVIRNPGAAFSLPIQIPMLFVAVAIIVTILVIRALPETESPVLATAYGLVVGGAFGNAIDRIWREGEVVDMIDLDFPPLANFPVFNVADIGITVGAALVAVLMIREDRRLAGQQAVLDPAPDPDSLVVPFGQTVAGSARTTADDLQADDLPADDVQGDDLQPEGDKRVDPPADADDADDADDAAPGPDDTSVLPPPAG